MKNVCIFGDSTAWGAWDLEKGGWANRLWLYVAQNPHNQTTIYNLPVDGGTTETILQRFKSEANIRNADALIFQSGGNDSYFRGENGVNNVPPDKFRRNLEKIIKEARDITQNIIFIGFKNVDEERTRPVSWDDVHYLNSEIEKYNKITKEVCQRESVLYLDIFGLLEKEDLADGAHPNSSGHEKIFLKVKDFLEKHKWL